MKNIIIIGGSGFIGSRLCQRLNNSSNQTFTIVDKVTSSDFSSKCSYADIRSIDELEKCVHFGDAIINLAAEHHDNVFPNSLYREVNVDGAQNVCDLAIRKGINKIIFTSSVAVYGFNSLVANESSPIAPFNEYGRTKWEAELIYKKWQMEDPRNRTLVIIRPTAVFGEKNRGNIFNLLRQVAARKFIMVGNGLNKKSMAYVENVAAFLEFSLEFNHGIHIFNYVDKPDFTMNELIMHVNKQLGLDDQIKIRLPIFVASFIGSCFDFLSLITNKKFSISAIRVKKFCANSVYDSAIKATIFTPPVSLIEGVNKTIRFEFSKGLENQQ